MQTARDTRNDDPVVRSALVHTKAIPPLTHSEAAAMARLELERFLALATSLSDDDWEKPTICPLWNVRQILAHVTGAAASHASWSEFKRQGNRKVQRPYRASGLSFLDSMNQIQVDDRASATPGALIDELRTMGPRAIATRERLPAWLRAFRVPLPALGGIVPIGYLTDLIYTRDMWMHRLDICRATGHEMIQTSHHDRRITTLVVRDLARKLTPRLGGRAVTYELTGISGGCWSLGENVRPIARITMDVLDFHLLAAGRLPANELSSHTSVVGDEHIARLALDNTQVPY
jgi:uncharacterized protein (TIGR03083 family)